MPSTQQSEAVRIWHRLLRLNTSIRLAMGDRLKDIGISVPQCDVLSMLMEEEGLSQQVLADRLFMTKGNISGLLDRLAKVGLVERRDTDKDRRTFAIYLTPVGREIAKKGIKIQFQYISESLGQIQASKLADLEKTLIEAREFMEAAKYISIQPMSETAV